MQRIALLIIVICTMFAVGCQAGGGNKIQRNNVNVNVTISPLPADFADYLD